MYRPAPWAYLPKDYELDAALRALEGTPEGEIVTQVIRHQEREIERLERDRYGGHANVDRYGLPYGR